MAEPSKACAELKSTVRPDPHNPRVRARGPAKPRAYPVTRGGGAVETLLDQAWCVGGARRGRDAETRANAPMWSAADMAGAISWVRDEARNSPQRG